MGLDAPEAERFAEAAERVHFDFAMASEIDAAEQGDEDGHGRDQYSAGRCRFVASA